MVLRSVLIVVLQAEHRGSNISLTYFIEVLSQIEGRTICDVMIDLVVNSLSFLAHRVFLIPPLL